jgi:hypothetical protein
MPLGPTARATLMIYQCKILTLLLVKIFVLFHFSRTKFCLFIEAIVGQPTLILKVAFKSSLILMSVDSRRERISPENLDDIAANEIDSGFECKTRFHKKKRANFLVLKSN